LYGLCVGFSTVSTSAAQGSSTEQGEEASSTLMKWCQVRGTELEHRVCWPRLKHLDNRGLHKLLFFYQGDVSKLCDLVRQRIVFDSLTDLCRCLEEIYRNPRLKVVCLKNRFDTDADMSRTAGYRDVLVRVCVCTETTQEFGVSGHVCELQLAHREMSLHLSPAQHKRYLDYKNASIFRAFMTFTSLSRGSSRGIIGIYLIRILRMLNRNMGTRNMSISTDLGRGQVDHSGRDATRFDSITRRNADETPLQDWLRRDGVHLGKFFSIGDSELESEMDLAVARLLRMRWHNGGGFLTSKLQTEAKVAVQRADTSTVLFLAPRLSLHKWGVVLALFICSALSTLGWRKWSVSSTHPFSFSARHVRFSVIETRQPNASSGVQFGNASTSAGIKALELELDGCPIDMDEAKVSGNKTTRFVSFPRPRLGNGWAITTLDEAGTAPADPVRFLIHVSPGVRKDKIEGKSPADCLVASGWSQFRVAQLGPLEVREQVVKIVKSTGKGWCDNDLCSTTSDAELLQMCLPPSHLDEDDWTLEGASSSRYLPTLFDVVVFRPLPNTKFEGHPLLRSGAVVHDLDDAGPNPFLPLVVNATRGARHSDNTWKEPQNLDAAYMQFSFFILLTAGCFCALLRWTDAALAMLALAILTRGAFQVAIAVLIDTNPVSIRNVDDPYASAHYWFLGLAEMCVSIVLYFFDYQFKYAPPILFVVSQLVVNLRLVLGFNVSKPYLHVFSSAFAVLWLIYVSLRQYVLLQTDKFITDDMSAYNKVWESLQTEEVGQDLLRLAETVIAMQAVSIHKQTRHLRQRYLTSEEMLQTISLMTSAAVGQGQGGGLGFVSEKLLGHPKDERTCLGTPSSILSLDLLYAQAMLLNPIFQIKVQQIALSSGFFLEILGSDRNDSNISFTPACDWPRKGVLKRVDRVIEKVVRSYKGDVSRICDIVRQCIAFDAVPDICRAIQAIDADPEIQVLRIKNRMSPVYDPRLSCGYRDVLLNVCIDSPLTRKLGLFKHVCELQLILKPFVRYKTIEGHKRYVDFRNRRCE